MEHETVSIACNLLANENTITELITLFKAILKHHISFAVRDIKTKELVAICVNNMVVSMHKAITNLYL